MKRITYIGTEQRALIDQLAEATARIHKVARRTTHLSKQGQRALRDWNAAHDALLHAKCGRKLWQCYCNLYQYNVRTVGLDFFV